MKFDDGTAVDSIETIYVPESEVVNLLFSKPLPVSQNATLSLQFTGELNDKMKGFYRSKYFTSTGEERFAGVTQFEATDARRCFPCWVRKYFCNSKPAVLNNFVLFTGRACNQGDF